MAGFDFSKIKKALSSYGISVFLVVSISFIIVYASKTAGDKNYASFNREFGNLGDSRNLDEKLAEINERLSKNPRDMQALFESGIVKYHMGYSRYIDAISDLEMARENGYTDVRTFYYLALMYQAVGLYDFAELEYARYINNRPDDLEARLMLARIHYLKGDYAGAAKEYSGLNARYPKNGVIMENMALSEWKSGKDYTVTLENMRKIKGEAACRADFVMGKIRFEEKLYYDSITALENLLSGKCAYPSIDKAEIYETLAHSYLGVKNDAGAMLSLRELLKLKPDSDEARLQLAKLEKKKKSSKK